MRATTFLSGLLLLGGSTAAVAKPVGALLQRRETQAADLIAAIMPTSTSCAGAEFPDECRTNVQAAPFLIQAMQTYKLYAPGQIAAVLALTALESVEMKYKHNISPGRPGQGTSNMQMANINQKYAASIPALSSGLAAAGSDVNAVLKLVMDDKYNFASGAWYLATQCDPKVLATLASDPDAGYTMHLGCVGVSDTSDRRAYWNKAKAAFGLA